MIASYNPIAPSALTAGANPTLSLSKGEGGRDRSAHSSSFVVRQAHHEGLGRRNEVVIAGGER